MPGVAKSHGWTTWWGLPAIPPAGKSSEHGYQFTTGGREQVSVPWRMLGILLFFDDSVFHKL